MYLALLLLTAFAAAADKEDLAKEKENMQGLWRAVALEANGQNAPGEVVKKFWVLIKGDNLVFNPNTENRQHTIVLDPKAQPKAMDLTPRDGPAKGKTLPCAIYKLDGDKLTICLDKEGQAAKRPSAFKTVTGDGFALITLERVKKAQ
jgi:uncharacterized protein (TIGR03067 family)